MYFIKSCLFALIIAATAVVVPAFGVEMLGKGATDSEELSWRRGHHHRGYIYGPRVRAYRRPFIHRPYLRRGPYIHRPYIYRPYMYDPYYYGPYNRDPYLHPGRSGVYLQFRV